MTNCFSEINYSASFQLTQVLIFHLKHRRGLPALGFMFPLLLEALHFGRRHNIDLGGDIEDVPVRPTDTPSLWKRNQLLAVH
jgi:hypothetical protein